MSDTKNPTDDTTDAVPPAAPKVNPKDELDTTDLDTIAGGLSRVRYE